MAITGDLPYLFPSVPWFRALADRAEAGPDAERFRRLGVVDTAFAMRVGDFAYRLVFDGFSCSEVAEWDGEAPVDFVLEAPMAEWRELVEHLQEHGSLDGAHSLNSLVLAGDRFRLSGDEQLGIDCFYRFNPSIQAFLELAASVPTIHRKPVVAA